MDLLETSAKVKPLCPVFLVCGGCAYQDIEYRDEIKIKEQKIRDLFSAAGLEVLGMDPMTVSPSSYHYRHRLDLAMKRTRDGVLFGFQSENSRRLIPVEACSIASQEVSNALGSIREQALEKFTAKYLTANVVIKTGHDGRVLWGGIGRRSLELEDKDYLFAEIHGKRIYYSLDTFFQANLAILPMLMDKIQSWTQLTKETVFFDLYSGVGLFGVYFSDRVGEVVFVENVPASVRVLRYNLSYHGITNGQIFEGDAEAILPGLLAQSQEKKTVLMVDPPRKGLHPDAAKTLAETDHLQELFYLSCHPESLIRDLKILLSGGWEIAHAAPFDFFPKTKHIETLVLLKKS